MKNRELMKKILAGALAVLIGLSALSSLFFFLF